MSISKRVKKGVKGFVDVPMEERYNVRGVYYLTEGEMQAFKRLCLEKGVLQSVYVRELIYQQIKHIKLIEDNPKQLRIE